jgi:hypothetical protein
VSLIWGVGRGDEANKRCDGVVGRQKQMDGVGKEGLEKRTEYSICNPPWKAGSGQTELATWSAAPRTPYSAPASLGFYACHALPPATTGLFSRGFLPSRTPFPPNPATHPEYGVQTTVYLRGRCAQRHATVSLPIARAVHRACLSAGTRFGHWLATPARTDNPESISGQEGRCSPG